MAMADLAMYRGEWSRAVSILERAIAGDRANDDASGIAQKLVAFAEAELALGREEEALAAVREAVERTRRTGVLVAAARTLIRAGRLSEARALGQELSGRLQSDPQAYAKLIEGEILLRDGDRSGAIRLMVESLNIADSWLARFSVGKAYLDAGAYTEAHSEFERCFRRRGEAMAVFLDDVPSYRHYPPLHYYLGLAQQGLGSRDARESLERYLAIRGGSAEDALVPEARRLLALPSTAP
jgi:tetratricopeptide (TPR) repeat protein